MDGVKGRFTHNAREFLVLKVELVEVCVASGGYDWTETYWFPGALIGS